MSRLYRFFAMLTWVFRRSAAERRLDDDLQTFVEMSAAAHMRNGASPAEARRLALIELGGIEPVKEQVRTGRHGAFFDEIGQNVRYALRMMARTPGFTVVIVLTLAFGIGANTAIFSIIDSLLLRPLPVQDPARLARLTEEPPGDQLSWTYGIYEQIHQRRDAFAGVAAWASNSFNLSRGGETDAVRGMWVSGGLFDLLGVPAALGRTITAKDDVRGGGADGPVVVISHGLWQRRFGGAPDVVGRTLYVERIPFTVIGVTPPDFFGLLVGRAFDVAVPFGVEPLIRGLKDSRLDSRNSWWVTVLVRVKPGQTMERAAAELRGFQPGIRDAMLAAGMSPSDVAEDLKHPLRLDADTAAQSSLRGQYREPLIVMLVVVGLVLLIACANIANLLLARATARGHEWSLRLALGASRARLARQVLTESLILAVIGAGAALAVAVWGSQLLVGQLSADAVSLDLALDWRVLGFTAAVTLITTLVFGIAPATRATRGAPIDALKDRGRPASGAGTARVAGGLVVAQVALSFVLVAGAGLFVRTFNTLTHVPLGFDSERVLMARVDATRAEIAVEERLPTYERIRQRLTSVPGVESNGLSLIGPLTGLIWIRQVDVSGSSMPREERNTGPEGIGFTDKSLSPAEPYTTLNAVTPGWMSTYGLTIRAGRDITDRDLGTSARIALVNETFVRKFLSGQHAIGHTLRAVHQNAAPTREIVGIVSDAAYRDVREAMLPTVYVPLAQLDRDAYALPPMDVILSVRAASGPPALLKTSVASAIAEVNPRLALTFRPLQEMARNDLVQERLLAMLSGFFGVLAVLMAAIGLYGVTAYSVSLRQAEIGIRLALGSTRAGVIKLVLVRVAVLVGIGTVAGVAVSVLAGPTVESLLFGLAPRDPVTLVGSAVLLAAVGLAAGSIPAYRASRLDPRAQLTAG
jgi:predicted permease